MYGWILGVAALLALVLADPAHALVQDTNTTVTNNSEIKEVTIKVEQPGRPAQTIKVTGKSSTKQRMRIDTDKPAKVTVQADGKTVKEENITGISLLRDGFNTGVPGVTFTSAPVTARAPTPARIAPGPTATTIQPTVETGGLRGEFAGIYVGVNGGASRASNTFTPTQYTSPPGAEPTAQIPAGANSTDFNIGGVLGYNLGNGFAGEIGVVWLNNKSTIAGLPGNIFPVTSNDTIDIKKDAMVTFSGFWQIPGLSVTGADRWSIEGGGALIRDRFTHNCPSNGWCGVAPTVSPFSASDSQWNWAWLLGARVEVPAPPVFGMPTNWVLGYQHIFANDFNVNTGSQATRAISGKVDQDIDRVYFGINVALTPQGQMGRGGAAVMSDRRLKTDIIPVAKRADGITLYRYRYLWSHTEYVGVMAQEVAALRPDAVLPGNDGSLRVDYSRLGLRLITFEDWSAPERVARAF